MVSKNIIIAVLGSTGHLAKGLIFKLKDEYSLRCFSRSPVHCRKFLDEIKDSTSVIKNYSELFNEKYDVILNCVGIGRYEINDNIFALTEKFDNLIISYLEKYHDCLCICFSSGSIFGNFSLPVDINSTFHLNINNIKPENFFSVAKLNSEAKHRVYKDYNIIDLRVFSYFSRFINIDSGYLITEIIKSLKNNSTFITNSENIFRDYSNPDDLFSLVFKCIDHGVPFNDVFDVYSKKPVSKFELLDFFEKKYGFKYVIDDKILINNTTGNKDYYYSTNYKAYEIGYEPKYSSLNSIDMETQYFLNKKQ